MPTGPKSSDWRPNKIWAEMLRKERAWEETA